MRIGLFTDQYYPYISGVVTSIKTLYEGLTALGHEVFIFTSVDEKTIQECEDITKVNYVNLHGRAYPFKELKDYRYAFRIKRIAKTLKSYNLDVIHIHTEFHLGKIALAASKMYKIPVVRTLHTLYEDYLKYLSPFFDKYFHNITFNFVKRLYFTKLSKKSVINIVPTKKVLALASRYDVCGDIRVVPTGIEIERFYKSNFKEEAIAELRKSLGIPEDVFVYGYIGRTSPEKNINCILGAFSKLENHDNCVLLIVGGGPQLPILKETAEKLNISDKVIFTGFVESNKIPIYYQIPDIFVNASKSETQGLTYIESLASSLPLLVQKDECIEEVIEDYYNGIYFDGEEELVVKMEEIKKAPTALKNITANTQISVQRFSKKQYAENIEKIYRDAIAIYSEKYKK